MYSDWSASTVGTFHTCGLRPGGEIWCAGRNTEGQIGAPDFVDALPDMMRADPTAGWVEVRAGRFFTCARKADDSVWCMGSNSDPPARRRPRDAGSQHGDGAHPGAVKLEKFCR